MTAAVGMCVGGCEGVRRLGPTGYCAVCLSFGARKHPPVKYQPVPKVDPNRGTRPPAVRGRGEPDGTVGRSQARRAGMYPPAIIAEMREIESRRARLASQRAARAGAK